MAIQIESKNGSTKLYEQVHERLARFRADHPANSGWGLISEIIEDNAQRIAIRTSILNPDGKVVSNGFAEELRGSSEINKTSAMENCETSSLGRALFKAGYGNGEVCTAEELVNALRAQEALKKAKISQTGQTENPAPTASSQPSAPKADPPKPETKAPAKDKPVDQPKAKTSAPEKSGEPATKGLDSKVVQLFKAAGLVPMEMEGINYAYDGKLLLVTGKNTGAPANRSKWKAAGFGWDQTKRAWIKQAA